jgi:hypothetical protein
MATFLHTLPARKATVPLGLAGRHKCAHSLPSRPSGGLWLSCPLLPRWQAPKNHWLLWEHVLSHRDTMSQTARHRAVALGSLVLLDREHSYIGQGVGTIVPASPLACSERQHGG